MCTKNIAQKLAQKILPKNFHKNNFIGRNNKNNCSKLIFIFIFYKSLYSRRRIPQMVRELESASADMLEDFIDGIKSDLKRDHNLPSDCTVHEINSNALHFVQSLQGEFIRFQQNSWVCWHLSDIEPLGSQ